MKSIFEKQNLPVISIEQLKLLFADLILWYDQPYCKNIEGAEEIVGEYMIRTCHNCKFLKQCRYDGVEIDDMPCIYHRKV